MRIKLTAGARATGATPALAAVALVAGALAVIALGPATAQTLLPTGFTDQLVLGSLDYPVGMAFLADGRLLFVEQKTARIRLIVNGALSAIDPVGTIGNVQTAGGEQGLLGIAVDPGWPARPYLYIHCDELSPPSTIRISRYAVTGDLAFTGNGALTLDAASRYDLINSLPDVASNHNGGTLRFGPDGRLYDSMGEDAQACLAQDNSTLHGVILRLDVSQLPAGPGGPPALALITPPDNPQVGASDPRTRLIWALGLRNPFRFHIDPADGSLFIADVGQNLYEEIDHATAGALDFGWPLFEGPAPFSSTCTSSFPLVAPIFSYNRSGFTASVISGGVYRPPPGPPPGPPNQFPPSYTGDYFFSDYYQGFLRRLRNTAGVWDIAPAESGQPSSTDWGRGFDEVSDYLVGPDGALWYCRQAVNFAGGSGQIRRVLPSQPPIMPTSFVSFAPPYPSPAPGYATLSFTLSVAATVDLTVFDARGRKVREVVPGVASTPGTYYPTWDGRDDDRHTVPPGLYFARLRALGAEIVRRVALIR